MARRLLHAQARKRGGVGQHLTARRGHRGAWSGDRLVLRPADVTPLPGLLPGGVGPPHKAGRRSARRPASLISPTPCCLAKPNSDAIGAERIGRPTWSRPSAVAVWRWEGSARVHSRRTAPAGSVSISGSPWATGSCESPWVLSIVWPSSSATAAARNCLINA